MNHSNVFRIVTLTAIKRYGRSSGLWLFLTFALLGGRFGLPRDDGTAVVIAVNDHLPVLSSEMIGTCLGIVVSTLLLPVGFLYLRSNVTRRQPWQVDEVTATSRVAISFGVFVSDATALCSVLVILTLAGYVAAWRSLPATDIHLWKLTLALWLVGAPAFIGLGAFRTLLDSIPLTRRAFGELLFFAFWMMSLTAPLLTGHRFGFGANMLDFTGAFSPLTAFAKSTNDIQIGFGGSVRSGRIFIDVLPVLTSRAYAAARICWVALSCLVVLISGLIYRPHRPIVRRKRTWLPLDRFASTPATYSVPSGIIAAKSKCPLIGLIVAEFRLIGRNRLFPFAAAFLCLLGSVGNYRHVVAPMILLLLIFPLTSQSGMEEAKGFVAIQGVTALQPALRRIAFCLAGGMWALMMSVPALVFHASASSPILALYIGLGSAICSSFISTLTRSAFAARLILLIAWFGLVSGS